MNEEHPKRLALTITETATSLGLSTSQVRSLIHSGVIVGVRLGPKGQRAKLLIPIEELEQVLRNSRVGGATLPSEEIKYKNTLQTIRDLPDEEFMSRARLLAGDALECTSRNA